MKAPKLLAALAALAFGSSLSAQELPPVAPAPVHTKIETKIITGPAAVFPHGETVDPATLKKRLAETLSEKGWGILSAPTVVTREGQEAVVEVGHEVDPPPGGEPKLIGIKLSLKITSGPGGNTQTKAHVTLTEAGGEKADSAPLLTFEQKFDGPIPEGHTVALVLPTKKIGQLATFLITPIPIGPEG